MINKASLSLYEVSDLSTFVYVAAAAAYKARLIAEDDFTVKRLNYLVTATVNASDAQFVDVDGKTLNERFQEMLKPGVVHVIRK